MKPNRIVLALAVAILALLPQVGFSQTTSTTPTETGAKPDSAIIFDSPRPLIETGEGIDIAYPNSWGFSAFFSDYGFGGGAYLAHQLGSSITGMLSLDLGTAKGPKEFGLLTEVKINRIFVVPVILSAQYRLFREFLSDNFRPYVTAGAGPVFVITTPAYQEFFSSFGSAQAKLVPGGFLGVGANFGVDKKSTFGANLRYYIIPYPAPGIESTAGVFLTNFNGLFLTVNYGFNF
jgi:hypothetical protein